MGGISLHEEYGTALSCYERALFHAVSANKSKDAIERNYDLDAKLSSEASPPSVKAICLQITDCYIKSAKLLTTRLKIQTNRHFVLRSALAPQWYQRPFISKTLLQARVPEQGQTDIILNRKQVGDSYVAIVNALVGFVDRDLEDEDLLIQCARNWVGLRSICHLYMDEIAHTTERIDRMNGIVDSNCALQCAIIGIIISIAISVISVFISGTSLYLTWQNQEASRNSSYQLMEVLANVTSASQSQTKTNEQFAQAIEALKASNTHSPATNVVTPVVPEASGSKPAP